MSAFDLIAFDADDTLWHTERMYTAAQAQLKQLLAQYHNRAWNDQTLYQIEMRNLRHFGYGLKAYTLSLIETIIELTEGHVSGRDIQLIIDQGKEMIHAEVRLTDYAAATVAQLAARCPLMLMTKGDLLEQEMKIARSGLTQHFRHIEIVSDKTRESYAALLQKYGVAPKRFLMIGNSLRSDILPVLALGGCAVYIPYPLTWQHEAADPPPADQAGYFQLEHLGLLPALIEQLNHRAAATDR